MKPIIAIVLFVATLQRLAFSDSLTGIVTRVIDGDTVVVEMSPESNMESSNIGNQVSCKVRLAAIDAPETSQPYGKKAASYLSSLILSRTVRIEFSKRDFFGRIIGTVFLDPVNPVDPVKKINSLLVTEGCAWHYRKYSKNKRLAQMEKEAREQRKGLWQKAKPMPPWKYRSVRKRERRSDCK